MKLAEPRPNKEISISGYDIKSWREYCSDPSNEKVANKLQNYNILALSASWVCSATKLLEVKKEISP
jgi:hypothetical protein